MVSNCHGETTTGNVGLKKIIHLNLDNNTERKNMSSLFFKNNN